MSTQAVETQRSGWIEFTAVLLFAIAFFRIISAIAYFANSNKIDNLAGGLFSSHLWAWGAWDLIIAVVAIFAGLSLLGRRRLRARDRLHLRRPRDRPGLHGAQHRSVVRGAGDRARRARRVRARPHTEGSVVMSRMWWIIVLVACRRRARGARRRARHAQRAVEDRRGEQPLLEPQGTRLVAQDADEPRSEHGHAERAADRRERRPDGVEPGAERRSAVQNAPTGSLDSAWSDFESAVKDIPNASSVSDATTSVEQAGQQLESAAQSTASSLNCS